MQGVGEVITKTHRCVAFPNLYQRQVQPFRLEDPTKPGHRRILAFFLVDLTQRIFSATDVAPQQRGWIGKTTHGAGQNSVFAGLSVELPTVTAQLSFTCIGPYSQTAPVQKAMTRLEAEEYRRELMSERIVFVEQERAYFGIAAHISVLRGD